MADWLPACVVGVAVAPSAAAEIGAVPTVPVVGNCVAVAFTDVAVGSTVVAVDFGAVAVACGVVVARCDVAVGLGAVAVGCAALLPTFADGLVGSGLVSAQIGARTEASNPLLPVPERSRAAIAVGWLKPSATSKPSTAPGQRLLRTRWSPTAPLFRWSLTRLLCEFRTRACLDAARPFTHSAQRAAGLAHRKRDS